MSNPKREPQFSDGHNPFEDPGAVDKFARAMLIVLSRYYRKVVVTDPNGKEVQLHSETNGQSA